MVWPAIIGAAATIGGSIIASRSAAKSQEKTNEANIAQQVLDREYQKEFAQSGIQWRVKDAQDAGVHPLYSLGASIPTFSPVSQNQVAPPGIRTGIGKAGQDISRAVAATSTEAQRYTSSRMAELAVQRGQLENENLRLQNRRLTAQVGPAFPAPSASAGLIIDGQGDSSRIKDLAQMRTTPHPDQMHSEPGAITDVGWAKTASGGYAPVPSDDVKQRIEDQLIPELAWALRNYGPQKTPPPFKPPPGMTWRFSYKTALWEPTLRRRPPRYGPKNYRGPVWKRYRSSNAPKLRKRR